SIEKLAKAGLDSLRVSINSLQPALYRAYYRPKHYDFVDVIESIKRMKRAGGFVSLNYFILPGVTDSFQEFEALSDLLNECSPDLIQLRNLNMDPEWYLDSIQFSKNNKAMGITNWFNKLTINFPTLRFGYFNPYLGV
ncbi:MAG: radical SAM protein, partial [Bacteroidetes bacterium]|nr:radical SAM protein [Bacteroidota bacterium]